MTHENERDQRAAPDIQAGLDGGIALGSCGIHHEPNGYRNKEIGDEERALPLKLNGQFVAGKGSSWMAPQSAIGEARGQPQQHVTESPQDVDDASVRIATVECLIVEHDVDEHDRDEADTTENDNRTHGRVGRSSGQYQKGGNEQQVEQGIGRPHVLRKNTLVRLENRRAEHEVPHDGGHRRDDQKPVEAYTSPPG